MVIVNLEKYFIRESFPFISSNLTILWQILEELRGFICLITATSLTMWNNHCPVTSQPLHKHGFNLKWVVPIYLRINGHSQSRKIFYHGVFSSFFIQLDNSMKNIRKEFRGFICFQKISSRPTCQKVLGIVIIKPWSKFEELCCVCCSLTPSPSHSPRPIRRFPIRPGPIDNTCLVAPPTFKVT